MSVFYHPKIEKLSLEQLEKLQFRRLRETIAEIYKKSNFYKKRLDRIDIKPEDIKDYKTFCDIPLMDKKDLLAEDPLNIMACDLDEIVTVYSSGGTTGKSKLFPTGFSYLERCEDVCARLEYMFGIREDSIVLLLVPMGIAQAGNHLMGGLRKLKAFTIPTGLGTDWQFVIELSKTFKITHFITTPATAVDFTKEVLENLNPKKDFHLRGIATFSAPLTKVVREHLEEIWGCEVFDGMGVTEIGALGGECKGHNGMHAYIDHFFMEVLNPDSLKPVKEGEIGELVATSLNYMGMPILRYRLNDLVKITYKPCKCGRLFPRIWMLGRTEHTIFLEGHKVYPFQVDSALISTGNVATNYQIIITKKNKTNTLHYKIEALSDKLAKDSQIKNKVQKSLENLSITFRQGVNEGRFKVEVEILLPGTLERTPRGKIKNQIIDKRSEI